jgi:hypothetical protein
MQKYLEDEVSNYRSVPIKTNAPKEKGKGLKPLHAVAAVVVGLLLGFFSPLSIFG